MPTLTCMEIDNEYRNYVPLYQVNLTFDEIKGLRNIVYSYDSGCVRGNDYPIFGGDHGFSWCINDLHGQLSRLFPNLDKGLGYKLCGQGEKAGDFRGLLYQNRDLFRRLLGIISAANVFPEAELTEEIKKQEEAKKAEALRQAEIARQAAIERAERAKAARLLEEAARANAEAAIAESAAQSASQHLAQLEAQLTSAQTATAEAKQLIETCAKEREAVSKTLTIINERVVQTVTHYTSVHEDAKAKAAIHNREWSKMMTNPKQPIKGKQLVAVESDLAHSQPTRIAARVTAEHAKLQQITALELQKSIDELAQLTEHYVTHRASAQQQTHQAVERASLAMANLAAHQQVAQEAAAKASKNLAQVASRLTAAQKKQHSNAPKWPQTKNKNPSYWKQLLLKL